MAEEFVTVAEFWTPFEAYVARAKLEDQGVPCVVDAETWASIYGLAYQRARLKVPEHLVERAEEILGERLEPPHQDEKDDAE
jgi:hypothetical protein